MFFGEPHSMNGDEVEAINNILDNLGYDGEFSIEKNSSDYTTLKYKGYDLFRIKIHNVKWISIFIPPTLKNKYIDSPLFKDAKKNTMHWQSTINNLYDYKDILLDVIEWINKA